MMKINEICTYAPKSNIKAGEATKNGSYMFFTSSSDESKRYCDYQFDGEGIIMGTGGNATLHYYNGKYAVSTDCVVLLPDKRVNCKYLYYFFLANMQTLEAGFKGAGLKHTNKNYIGNIEFGDIPSIEKQKQTIEIFDKLSEMIENRKQQLQQLDELVKARFVELFGDINTNDKGWETQPLGELCTIVRGGSPRPIENYLGGDVPWIKIGDATKGDNVYLHSTKEHIIQDGVKKSRMVKSGSLIFANCGVSLGFARIITFDGCIHDGWLAIEDIDERLDKVFLLQALNQMTDHFRNIAPAGTQPNLNTAIMKAYVQIIPPMELQRAYIAFVEQIDKSKFVIQKSLDETQMLFDSLMQEYFG